MKKLSTFLAAAAMTAAGATSALAEKWDMPLAYSASNYHSVTAAEFASCVTTGTGGDPSAANQEVLEAAYKKAVAELAQKQQELGTSGCTPPSNATIGVLPSSTSAAPAVSRCAKLRSSMEVARAASVRAFELMRSSLSPGRGGMDAMTMSVSTSTLSAADGTAFEGPQPRVRSAGIAE